VLTDLHSSLSTPVPAGLDQRSEMTSENVEHDMSQLAASRAHCSKNLAASWTLDENSLVGELALEFVCLKINFHFFVILYTLCPKNDKVGC